MTYAEFLKHKAITVADCGFEADVPDFLYPFQAHIVKWALRKGRAAIFADCGLGKTPMQLAWADAVSRKTGKPVLIFAPLAVAEQTQREGDKFSIPVNVCETEVDILPGVNVTNYQKLHHFSLEGLGGLVLDESSILKNEGGKYRQQLTDFVKDIPYRLCCTATPAPNDNTEITNHSEFLGVANRKEVLGMFFRQDGNNAQKFRLKGHAIRDFWRWLASWAVAVRSPTDLGYEDDGFTLPPLNITQHTADGHMTDGFLFPIVANTMQERQQARRESVDSRVAMCANLANNSTEPWVIWCGLNSESAALKAAIPDSVEVKGSDSNAHKINALAGFSSGKYRVMVTKPSIAGFGLNWQHCHNMAFVGLSDSFEQLYQAQRRCWRFGQEHEVDCHLVVAETEGAVIENIRRKEHEASEMMRQLVEHMGECFVKHKDESRYNGVVEMAMPDWMG